MAPTTPASHVYRAWDWLTVFGLGLVYLIVWPLGGAPLLWLPLVGFAVWRDPQGALTLRGLIPASWLAGSRRWPVIVGLVILSPLLVFAYLFQVARQSHNAYAALGDWLDNARHLGRKVTRTTLAPPSPVWPDGVLRHDATLPDQPALATATPSAQPSSPPPPPSAAAIVPAPPLGFRGWVSARRRNMVLAVSGGVLSLCLVCGCISTIYSAAHPAPATNGKNSGGGVAVHPTQPPHATAKAGATVTIAATDTVVPTETAVPSATSVPLTATPRPRPTATATPRPKYPPIDNNPYDYNYSCCHLIFSPAGDICSYLPCIASFWNGTGYMVECGDGDFSLSGGKTGVCSKHGSFLRNVYKP